MNEHRLPIEKSTSSQDHEYFSPLIESYIRSILKSGLLLDEDLEVLLSVSKFKNFPEQRKYQPPISLVAGILSMVASSYVASKYQLPLVIVPSAVMTITWVTYEFKNAKRKKSNKEIINRLIEVIVKVHKLNIGVIRYVKTRADLGKANEQELITLYNSTIQEFLTAFERNNKYLFEFLMDNLKNISLYSVELCDDFKSLEHLIPSVSEDEDKNSIEKCLALTQRIQDLHVFFASKLLSYTGIGLQSKVGNLMEQDVSSMINKRLPMILDYLQQHYDLSRKQFVLLRQSMTKRMEYKLQATKAGKKQISGKLQEGLVCSVNNLSIILEKSQNVLDRLEGGDEDVGNAIVDLKNHTYATYESLDLLCKLYGILSNSTSGKQGENVKVKKTDIPLEEALPKVNYDDDSEPLEEKFELYVGDEVSNNEHHAATYDESQSGAYLSLMLQELKQSLKQHQRFIDAKNRRGSEDDEEIETRVVTLRQSPPKFNLQTLKDKQDDIPQPSCVGYTTQELPMPPPPPLPSFSLTDLEQEPGRANTRSMLDNIRALSSQIDAQEEVFGDSDLDSNCSD